MADVPSQLLPFDLDTGGGTEYVLGVSLRISAAGTSAEAKAQTTMALSIPVVIASDQSALDVSASTVTVTDDGSFTLAANSGIDIGDVDVTSVIPGVGATNLGKAIDTPIGGTDTGVLSLAVRDDVLSALTPAAADVVNMFVDANGALWTHDNNFPLAAALADNFANPTAPGVGAFMMAWDGATWDRALGDATDGLLVNLGTNNDVSITGSVDTELPAAAALADDVANPTVPAVGAFLMGWDSGNTNWNRAEVDDAGHLQIDVLTGGGVDTPTSPTTEALTSAALAVDAEVDLTGSEAANKKLSGIWCWCSQRWKAAIYTVDDAVESGIKGIFGGQAGQGFFFKAPHRNFITLGAAAGLDAFRVKFKNLGVLAADVHAVIYAED